jgi:hypothetical protein
MLALASRAVGVTISTIADGDADQAGSDSAVFGVVSDM